MNARKFLLSVAAVWICAASHAQPRNAVAVPLCSADQLSLATDDENGAFDGMSHSGTLLVLRNLGTAACRVEPFPSLKFLAKGTALATKAQVDGAKFMHPGPVVLPVVIAPGAEVTAKLRWVSGEVFDHSVCITPDHVKIAIGSGAQMAALAVRMCGMQGKPVEYTMTRFVVDPVYKP